LLFTRRRLIGLAGASLLLPSQARALTHGSLSALKYPVLNPGNPLANGMVGAYFPGYGAPVVDATGTWDSLVTSAYGVAGALTNNSAGRAMSFDGLLNGVWCTGPGFPLGSATQFTIGCVCEITGPPHEFGGCFALSNSTSPSQYRLLLGWTTYNLGAAPEGYGWFYYNPEINAFNNTVYSPVQPLPSGLAVLLATFDTQALTSNYYLNGSSVGTEKLLPGSNLSSFDTISIGCRITAPIGLSPVTLTSESNVGSSAGLGEDIGIGSPITDAQGFVPAGTYITDIDTTARTMTMSQAATGDTTGDNITMRGPLTRLMNGAVNLGVLWNRTLSAGEIAAFSGDPAGPFYVPGA